MTARDAWWGSYDPVFDTRAEQEDYDQYYLGQWDRGLIPGDRSLFEMVLEWWLGLTHHERLALTDVPEWLTNGAELRTPATGRQYKQWLLIQSAELGVDRRVIHHSLARQAATVLGKPAHKVTKPEIIRCAFQKKTITYPPLVALTPYAPPYNQYMEGLLPR